MKPAGRCHDCVRASEPDRSRCRDCARARRRADRDLYAERRRRGRCLTCGRKAKRGRRYCVAHLTYYLERYYRCGAEQRRARLNAAA
jgi:hypothetical protein